MLKPKEEAMKKPKQLLQWIHSMLDEEKVSDFCWVDRNKQIFQVPWPHASSSLWQKEHSQVFILWADHKGKLKGRERDYKSLKATFRCALNSRRELRELKEERTKHYRQWQIILPKSSSACEASGMKIAAKEGKRKAKTKLSCKVSKEKRINEIKMQMTSAFESSPERSSSYSGSDSNFDMQTSVNYEDSSCLPSFNSLLRYQPRITPQEMNQVTSFLTAKDCEEFIDRDFYSFDSYDTSDHQLSSSNHQKESNISTLGFLNDFRMLFDYETVELSDRSTSLSESALLDQAYSSIFHPNTNTTLFQHAENNGQSQQSDIGALSFCMQKSDLLTLR